MAVIKHIAIHNSPMNLFKYILREDDPDEDVIVTGLNCSEDSESAYDEFRFSYEYFSGKPFYSSGNLNGKSPIKLHHYIQSFKPGEVTPEEAHKIGEVWAKIVFGIDRQILISTHTDKNHIHNHFAVAVFDLYGERWIDNKQTLKICRDKSDKLCRDHNLSVIENPSKEHNHKYGEWKARQQKRCWKDKLREDIDKLVLRDDVRTINDLVGKLKEMGYTVTFKKYLTVKSPKAKHAIRTFRLGDGYALEELKYRIEYKQSALTFDKIMQYQGIARDYAMCMRQTQLMLISKQTYDFPRKITYREVQQNAEILRFITENKITSEDEFKKSVNDYSEKYSALFKKQEEIKREIEKYEKIISYIPDYLKLYKSDEMTAEESKYFNEICKIMPFYIKSEDEITRFRELLLEDKKKLKDVSDKLNSAESNKNVSAKYYENYIRSMQSDYDVLLDKARKEYEKYLNVIEEEKEMQRLIEKYPYLANSYENNDDRDYYSR